MYLDPGLGGMLIQIAVAAVAAGGALVFAMRKKIRAAFKKDKKQGGPEGAAPQDAAPSRTEASEDDALDMLADDD